MRMRSACYGVLCAAWTGFGGVRLPYEVRRRLADLMYLVNPGRGYPPAPFRWRWLLWAFDPRRG